MKLHNNNDKVAQDNKNALKKFIPMMIASLLLGGVLGEGIVAVWIGGDYGILDTLGWVFSWLAPVLTLAVTVVGYGLSTHWYRKGTQILSQWDGEDETTYDEADYQMSCALTTASLSMIVVILFFSVGAVLFCDYENFLSLGVSLIGLGLTLIWAARMSQKVVDALRRISPEKEGSVYQKDFQQQWLNSCDEAEKAQIAQASIFAFQTVNGKVCPILWLVAFLLSFTFGCGPLPPVMVSVIWLALSGCYYWSCMKQSKKARN